MKKTTIIVWSIVVVVVLLIIGGIGVKTYMDKQAEHQAQQEQLEKNLAESKKEIIELLEWNYKNVQTVSFGYDGKSGSGAVRVSFDSSLTTTPAGGLVIHGFVNGNNQGDLGFSAELNPDTMELDGNSGGYPMLTDRLYKNPNPMTGRNQSPENYYLTPSDIKELKKRGFTKDITFEQIRHYFDERMQ
jgi:hypothetical protein